MTQATLTGKRGTTGNTEKSDGWGSSNIRKVTVISQCSTCGKGRCLVELENGVTAKVHDDGSFWRFTGGQE